ncbi:cytochrome P450 [Nonomuraea soli]|uniref:Cytochrome P450 n=1 Tax=Nonomuraea soli TaxID=1032476 RepID=A0A7W0CMF6_9ACTN|nr:cytochrome P450 [Nonomuraea soli]MBA2893729.1 cytochrome P450 [Nonomuraea soli]
MSAEIVPGPLGTPCPDFVRRRESAPLDPALLPSGHLVPLAVRYSDVRALLGSPVSSRNLRLPGLPRLVSGRSIDDDPDSLINQDPPEHTRYRRIMFGAFTPQQAERWRPQVAELAEELLDGLGTRFDLMRDFGIQLTIRMICRVLGVSEEHRDRFIEYTALFLSTSTASQESRMRGYQEFIAFCAELVARHRAEPGDDLIDLLIQARDEGDRLTEGELVNTVQALIAAGYETTASMISKGVLRLLTHPDQWAELVADPKLAAAAAEEVLRYDGPPASAFMRRMTADVEIPSGKLAAGAVVLPHINAANHDPEVFAEPERFDIHRFGAGPPNHLAFGYGAHRCLAAALARVELVEALRALATKRPGLRLAVAPEEIRWTDGLVHAPLMLPVDS